VAETQRSSFDAPQAVGPPCEAKFCGRVVSPDLLLECSLNAAPVKRHGYRPAGLKMSWPMAWRFQEMTVELDFAIRGTGRP
jgi:hypothetical protein